MMFQWDAVDTNPDLEGQNVIKSFEMAIRHNRRTTRTELLSFFVAGFILTDVQKYFFLAFLWGGGASAPIVPAMYPPLVTASERSSPERDGVREDICWMFAGCGSASETGERAVGLLG